jgi:hypothetical protein
MFQVLEHNFWTASNDSERYVNCYNSGYLHQQRQQKQTCAQNKYIHNASNVKLVTLFVLLYDRSLFTSVFIIYHYCQHVTDHWHSHNNCCYITCKQEILISFILIAHCIQHSGFNHTSLPNILMSRKNLLDSHGWKWGTMKMDTFSVISKYLTIKCSKTGF